MFIIIIPLSLLYISSTFISRLFIVIGFLALINIFHLTHFTNQLLVLAFFFKVLNNQYSVENEILTLNPDFSLKKRKWENYVYKIKFNVFAY